MKLITKIKSKIQNPKSKISRGAWIWSLALGAWFFGLGSFCYAQSADDLYLKAKVNVEYKQYQNAIDNFSDALILNNSSRQSAVNSQQSVVGSWEAKVYIERGLCYFQLKKYSEALADFMKADSLESNIASFHIARCQALSGNNDVAMRYIKNNLQSKYKVSQRIFKLEKIFEPLQKSTEWKDIWKKDWYSSLENSISELTYFYENNKNDKALELADALLLKHNNNFNLLYLRGKILIALNDLDAAENDFSKLIQLKPYEAELYAERADIYLKLNKYNKTLQDINKAIELDHFNMVLFKTKAYAEWKLKQYDKALENLNKYISYYNNDEEAKYSCGLISYDKQDYFGALVYFNSLLEKNKKEIKYFVARGNTYLMCKSYKYAEQDFTQALDLNPNTANVYLNRGITRFEQGKIKGACRDWQKAFDLKSDNAQDYLEKRCKQ